MILTYALFGFANFDSLGIMIGGMATMVPERHAEIADLGMKSIVAGTLVTCMTGAVVGMLLWATFLEIRDICSSNAPVMRCRRCCVSVR